MEESAPKRRRISPRTSAAAASSRDATQQAQDEDARPRPRRPSFASPTRASLARYNPGVLERRRSSSPSKLSKSARPSLQRISASQPAPGTTAENAPASEPTEQVSEDDAVAHEEGDTALGSGRATLSARGGMAMPPRRSPAKPNPRPLPPPGPEGEDDFNPFLGRVLRRSPDTGPSFTENHEPDLPPVTSDPVSSTPPRGIHSSPSRWREKPKQKKSSPLKPSPTLPSKATAGKGASSRGLSRLGAQESQSQSSITLDESTSAARQVPEFDPNVAKRKERDALREEISRLRKDLELADRENERIRFMQTSGRLLGPADEDTVKDIVQRHLLARDPNAQLLPSQQLLKMALDPRALLPFGKPNKTLGLATEDAENWNNIKSHHPLSMTAEQELPYLELFSPFSISSTIAMLPSEPPEPLKQQYSIKLRSKNPPGFFNARVEMTVNATDLGILELEVPALEPAARFELTPFIDKICTGDCNRSMQKNVGLVTWAMGEWYQVATQRGLLWAQLNKELSTKEDVIEATSMLRWKKTQRTEEEDMADGTTSSSTSCSRAELLRYMGQQAFDFEVPGLHGSGPSPNVRLEWKIDFDWTGEAQSKIDVKIGVAGKWHKQDTRGALGQIPKLFKELVEGGEKPALAAKTIVALLVGEES